MTKDNIRIIMRPLVACTSVALILMLLGLAGFGAWVLDVTGHIEPGETLADKMENGIAGMELMYNIAYACMGAGALASLGVLLAGVMKRSHTETGESS